MKKSMRNLNCKWKQSLQVSGCYPPSRWIRRQTWAKAHHCPCAGRSLRSAVCDSVVRDRRHEKESGTDMRGKAARRVFSLCCAVIFALMRPAIAGIAILMMKNSPLREVPATFSGKKQMITRKPMITICISWMKMVRHCIVIPMWGAK